MWALVTKPWNRAVYICFVEPSAGVHCLLSGLVFFLLSMFVYLFFSLSEVQGDSCGLCMRVCKHIFTQSCTFIILIGSLTCWPDILAFTLDIPLHYQLCPSIWTVWTGLLLYKCCGTDNIYGRILLLPAGSLNSQLAYPSFATPWDVLSAFH